jgi:transposase
MVVATQIILPREGTMTRDQYIIARKLNIAELGEVLGNVSEACRRLGVSRQHYYDIKKTLQEEGVDGLLEKARTKPRLANRVNGAIEDKILAYSLEYPTHGQVRVANELRKQGVVVSAGGIRGVWLRHGLEKKAGRLKRLERWSAEANGILTESQVKTLEAAKEEKEAHGEIETGLWSLVFGRGQTFGGRKNRPLFVLSASFIWPWTAITGTGRSTSGIRSREWS